MAVLAFLPIRKLCQRPRGRPPGTHQARCRSRALPWTVRSQQGFVARGSEGKKQAHTGEGRAWMGEVILSIRGRAKDQQQSPIDQRIRHCLQHAYSDPGQVPHRSADNEVGSPLLTHCRVIGPGISSMGVRPSFFRGHHTTTQLTLSSQVSVSDRLCTCQTAEPRPHI